MNVLDLEEFEVLEGYDSEQYYKFVVEAKKPPYFCTKCMATGEVDAEGNFLPSPFKKHDTRPRTVADVDLRGKKVVIEILQKRYKCPHCGEIFTEYFESIARNDRVTQRLFKRMVRLGVGYSYDVLRAKILFGTKATEIKKVKDMQFRRIFNEFTGRYEEVLWTHPESEYAENYSYRVNINELLEAMERGDI